MRTAIRQVTDNSHISDAETTSNTNENLLAELILQINIRSPTKYMFANHKNYTDMAPVRQCLGGLK
jgi:hypothetical protein